MVRSLHIDRWLIWTIAITIIIAMFVWYKIQLAIIEADVIAAELQTLFMPYAAPSAMDVSRWKIYRSEIYGFEVRYPNLSVTQKENKFTISNCKGTSGKPCPDILFNIEAFPGSSIANLKSVLRSEHIDFVTDCHFTPFRGKSAYNCSRNAQIRTLMILGGRAVLKVEYKYPSKIAQNITGTLNFLDSTNN